MKFYYPGFKTKALTFSYDDNTEQDRRLTKLLRSFKLLATFNINTGSFGQKGHLDSHGGFYCEYNRIQREEVRNLYLGFEVASHTVNHVNLVGISDEVFEHEVVSDCDCIEELCGVRPIGLAYPCGVYDDVAALKLERLGICYARTVEDTHSFVLPDDFLKWHPTCHDHDPQVLSLAEKFINLNSDELSVFYIWGHSFEFDKTDSDRWADMETLCSRLSGRDDIWYATNCEICNYINAIRHVSVSEDIDTVGTDLYVEINGKKTILNNK